MIMRVLGDVSLRDQKPAVLRPRGWLRTAGRAVFFIHGYNVPPDQAHEAYRRFMSHLAGWPSGARWGAGRVTWPGELDWGLLSFLGVLSYPFKPQHARESGEGLAKLLTTVRGPNGTRAEISLIAHSLGCRLAVEMLKELHRRAQPMSPTLRLVCLMAGAVPVTLLSRGSDLRPARHQSRYLLVLHSPGDKVLRFAFPAGQTGARLLGERHGERRVYWRALGLHGEPTDLTEHRYRHFVAQGKPADHSDYWPSALAAEHVARYLGDWTPNRLRAQTIDTHPLPPSVVRSSRRVRVRRRG